MTVYTKLVITDGRRKFAQASFESWATHIPATDYTVVVDDSAAPLYSMWVEEQFPDAEHIAHSEKQGLAQAIRTGWQNIPPDTDYVIHLEDDCVFVEDVDLDDWSAPLRVSPLLAQVVLQRGPNNGDEHAAGGILKWMQARNITVVTVSTSGVAYTIHQHLFSLQPCMYRRQLTDFGWPAHGGEREFTDELLAWEPKTTFAYLGTPDTEPVYDHVGFARRSQQWVL